MQRYKHEAFVKCIKFGVQQKMVKYPGEKTKFVNYIVMDLAQRGCLFDIILQSKEFPEKLARHYFKSLIDCLLYLHNEGACQRDIKLQNLLLTNDFKLKVCDFGHAA